MAKYGAKHIRWAPISEEPASSKPTYGAALALAKLQKVTDSPAFNEAKQYGDDELAEFVAEFKEVGVDVEVTDISLSMYAALFGAQDLPGSAAGHSGAAFTTEDTAPYGGLAFVCCKQVNNVKSYYGVFYPKLKAVLQSEEFNTKGDSITIAGGKLKFTGSADKRGHWRDFSEDFAEVSDAIAWVDALFTTPEPGGGGGGEENPPNNQEGT